jgi:hypothetical protein
VWAGPAVQPALTGPQAASIRTHITAAAVRPAPLKHVVRNSAAPPVLPRHTPTCLHLPCTRTFSNSPHPSLSPFSPLHRRPMGWSSLGRSMPLLSRTSSGGLPPTSSPHGTSEGVLQGGRGARRRRSSSLAVSMTNCHQFCAPNPYLSTCAASACMHSNEQPVTVMCHPPAVLIVRLVVAAAAAAAAAAAPYSPLPPTPTPQ